MRIDTDIEKPYLYVRAEVLPADPSLVARLQGIVERAGGQPSADIASHIGPGEISFKHKWIVAVDPDDAYTKGQDLLPPPQEGAICNDYVVAL